MSVCATCPKVGDPAMAIGASNVALFDLRYDPRHAEVVAGDVGDTETFLCIGTMVELQNYRVPFTTIYARMLQ